MKINKSNTHNTGFQVLLVFYITQHIRDTELLKILVNYFGCGSYNISASGKMAGDYTVTKFKDINEKIVPFFTKYPLRGIKSLNFLDFCRAVEIVKAKTHLTPPGLEEIRRIKEGMNRGRVDI